MREQELALVKGMVSERLDDVIDSAEGLEENMQEMHAQSNKFYRPRKKSADALDSEDEDEDEDEEMEPGTRIFVAGRGRGRYVSFERSMFGANTHRIRFDSGETAALKLREEQWAVTELQPHEITPMERAVMESAITAAPVLDDLEGTMAEDAVTTAAETAEQEALRASLRFCVRFNWMEKKGCALPRSRAACPASALAANDSSLVCRGIRPNWLRRKFAPDKLSGRDAKIEDFLTLAYFGEDGEKKGTIDLGGAEVRQSTSPTAEAFEMEIETTERTWRLRAPGEAEMDAWLRVLNAAVALGKATGGAARR